MIGLALCKHDGCAQSFLFQMPRYASLKEGDHVIVETKNGEQEARVVAKSTFYGINDDDYKMIVAATGAKEPLKKVLKKIIYEELKYDDDDLAVWDSLEKDPETEAEEGDGEGDGEM